MIIFNRYVRYLISVIITCLITGCQNNTFQSDEIITIEQNNNDCLSQTDDSFIYANNFYTIHILKKSGTISSLKLKKFDFEFNSDLSPYGLFYPEYSIEHENHEEYGGLIPERHGEVIISVEYENQDLVVLSTRWTTDYMVILWKYFLSNHLPYFSIFTERSVLKNSVFGNFQQCCMVNPDMDDSYLVNYLGQFIPTMLDGIQKAPYTAEHSMFTYIDYGKGIRFPAFAWHDTETNLSIGMIVPYVSPNQRATISYHGGGSSGGHPGFGEGQWNLFGKSDSESLFIKNGTKFSLEIIYYPVKGDADIVDSLNRVLFCNEYKKKRKLKNYTEASWGARKSTTQPQNPKYSWYFPEASSNYFATQQLFRHNAISIPRSQNGTNSSDFFSAEVFGIDVNGNTKNFSPISPSVEPFEFITEVNETGSIGGLAWEFDSVYHRMTYQVSNDSSYFIICNTLSGNLKNYRNFYMNINFTQRISKVDKIGSSVIVTTIDSLLGEIGFKITNLTNENELEYTDERIKISFMNNDPLVNNLKVEPVYGVSKNKLSDYFEVYRNLYSDENLCVAIENNPHIYVYHTINKENKITIRFYQNNNIEVLRMCCNKDVNYIRLNSEDCDVVVNNKSIRINGKFDIINELVVSY